jgi:hypothetical protein
VNDKAVTYVVAFDISKFTERRFFMKLSKTVEMMNSKDYKERFKAEYYQLENRCNGLKTMLEKWDNGTLEFTPTCPREIYDRQLKAMEDYAQVLDERAEIEGIF